MALSDRIIALTAAIATAINARAPKVGASAYDLAVINGYAGTQAQWLANIPGSQRFTTLAAMNAAVATAPQGMLFALGTFAISGGTAGTLQHRYSLWQVVNTGSALPVTPIILEGGNGTPSARVADVTQFRNLVAAQSALYLYPNATTWLDPSGNEFLLTASSTVRILNSEWVYYTPNISQGSLAAGDVTNVGRYRFTSGKVRSETILRVNNNVSGYPTYTLPIASDRTQGGGFYWQWNGAFTGIGGKYQNGSGRLYSLVPMWGDPTGIGTWRPYLINSAQYLDGAAFAQGDECYMQFEYDPA